MPQPLGLPTLKPQNIVETADVRKFEKWMGVNFATAARHEKLPLMKGAGAQCRETTNWVRRRRLLNWVKILKLEWSSWNSEQFNLVKVQTAGPLLQRFNANNAKKQKQIGLYFWKYKVNCDRRRRRMSKFFQNWIKSKRRFSFAPELQHSQTWSWWRCWWDLNIEQVSNLLRYQPKNNMYYRLLSLNIHKRRFAKNIIWKSKIP